MSMRLLPVFALFFCLASHAEVQPAQDLSRPLTIQKHGSQTWGSYRLANGLEVLIISDAQMKKAAAAMSVNAGSWSEPKDAEGIAHFLEHMLFMGTKTYPGVDDYGNYLSQNGGMSNAYTANTSTNYFFEVNPAAYAGALDRFSKFFSEPLFNPEYVAREKNNVHSEYEKNLLDEGWRNDRITGQAAPSGHPEANFNIGTRETLASIDRDRLIQFYEAHYSANNMKLVLMSPQTVEAMKPMADAMFAAVVNRNLDPNPFKTLPNALKAGSWVEIKALKAIDNLSIQFPVPSTLKDVDSKPLRLLAMLVSDESAGSLIAALKKDNLISSGAGGTNDAGDSGSFRIEMQLTKKGAKRIPQILETVFAYIEILKKEGLKKYVYDENATMARLELENRGVEEGGNAAVGYASSLQKQPAEGYLENKFLIKQYDPQVFAQYLEYFRPDNMTVFHHFPEAKIGLKERFFQIDYSIEPVAKDLIEKLKKPAAANVHYQAANPYIPSNFALLKNDQANQAVVLQKNEKGTLYFQQEKSAIAQPKGNVSLFIYSDKIGQSPKQQMLASIYRRAIVKAINEVTYPMVKAGYDWSIDAPKVVKDANLNSMLLTVGGYSDGLMNVTHNILSNLNRLELSAEDFDAIMESFRDDLANYSKLPAYERAMNEMGNLLWNSGYPMEEMGKELNNIKKSDLEEFTKSVYNEIYVDGIVYGNIGRSQAAGVIDQVYKSLGAKPLAEKRVAELRLKRNIIPRGSKLVSLIAGDDNNNAFMTVYQAGMRTPQLDAQSRIAAEFFDSSYYTEMRSNLNLGYIVWSVAQQDGITASQTFIIQTAKAASEAAGLSNAYIQKLSAEVAANVETTLEPIKDSLLEQLERARNPTTMKDRNDFLAKTVFAYRGNLNWSEELTAAMKAVTPADMRTYLGAMFGTDSQARISVYYSGSAAGAPASALPDETVIDGRAGVTGLAPSRYSQSPARNPSVR